MVSFIAVLELLPFPELYVVSSLEDRLPEVRFV